MEYLSSAKSIVRKLVKGRPTQPTLPTIPNEAVNFERKAIFIAVPKTGTTSIRRQLSQQGSKMIPNPHLTILQVRDSLYTYFLLQELERNHSFPTDMDRVASDEEIRKRAARTFDAFFKFGSVRNPWARTLSLYKRREGVQVSSKCDFESFCEQLRYASDTCRHPTRVKNQMDWLVDENGNLLVDYVLKLEERDKGIREIFALTEGRLELENLHLNKNLERAEEAYRDVYSPKARNHVEALFRRDIEFFGYEF